MPTNIQNLTNLDAITMIDVIVTLQEQMTKLSTQMIKNNLQIFSMIQTLDNKLGAISAEVDSLRADAAELQALATHTAGPSLDDRLREIADTHNEASKIKNSFIDNRNATLNTLRSEKNKEIPGFPKTIFDLDCLSSSQILYILVELGCILITGVNNKYWEIDLRRTLHFHLGIEDRFPARV